MADRLQAGRVGHHAEDELHFPNATCVERGTSRNSDWLVTMPDVALLYKVASGRLAFDLGMNSKAGTANPMRLDAGSGT